jgi:hypothetical protein
MHSKIFFRTLISVVGITSGFITILLAFWSDFPKWISGNELKYFISLIAFNVIISLFLSRKVNNISLSLKDNLNVKVFYGDLFKMNGIKIIPVNEYFDTLVDNKVISDETLHGIFINKFFKGKENNLKEQIDKGLKEVKPLGIRESRESGNKAYYPLGTVVPVKSNDEIFFLVALTEFNKNHRANVKKSQYQRVLSDLFDYIEQFSQGKQVSFPLIGSGQSGVDLNYQKLLEFLIFSMNLSDKLTLINGANIVLHSSVEKSIDLNLIKYYYKTLD